MWNHFVMQHKMHINVIIGYDDDRTRRHFFGSTADACDLVTNDDIREKHLFCFQLNKSKKGQSGALAFIEFKYSSRIVMYIHVLHNNIAFSVDLITIIRKIKL